MHRPRADGTGSGRKDTAEHRTGTNRAAGAVWTPIFLARRCGYLEIVRSIEYALGKSSFAAVPSLGDLGEANAEARCLAAEYLRL